MSTPHWVLICRVSCLFLAFLAATALATPQTAPADQLMAQGSAAFQRGQFERAVVVWQQASNRYAEEGKRNQQFDALLALSDAYQSLGQSQSALEVLELARTLIKDTEDDLRNAALLGSLGKAYWLSGATDQAKTTLADSITLAQQVEDSRIAAMGLNHLGNLLTSQGEYSAARVHYEKGLTAARQSGDKTLVAKLLTNMTRAAVRDNDHLYAESQLMTALQQTRALSDSHDKAQGLIALGQLCVDLPTAKALRCRPSVEQAFQEAAIIANAFDDQRTLAYAWGYLGQLYEKQQRNTEALTLTRRAIFAAQQAQAPEILYRWQWQVGQLLKAEGDMDAAILAYRHAVMDLQTIRSDLTLSYANRSVSFREAVGDVFFELADLLLQRAEQRDDPRQRAQDLLEAQNAVEQLRSAELKDYYQDDCVVALQSRITQLDRPPPRTAVLYPILLPDRIALLLTFSEGIKSFQAPPEANRETLQQTVGDLRRFLEKRTTQEYLPHAQRLFGWLIAPITKELQAYQVDTLVLVPDGSLRTIPLAALHDGKDFLIRRYAVATTPGLTLTDLQPLKNQEPRVLLNGLTKPVAGFSPLAYVSDELQAIHQRYGGKVFKDEDFLVDKVGEELTSTPYSIVHIASHGRFENKVEDTFILAFNDKLTMDRLERFMSLSQFREQPVELLTLSACQTAAGDERAALGLAGVAVKAGARSALATLWYINDQSTALLISDFYEQLQNPDLSKAKALQQAQLKRLADDNYHYRHPGYWAPFLLIGNWL